jgi:hypothetical protein
VLLSAARPTAATAAGRDEEDATMATQVAFDSHSQLRALYQALLSSQDYFDEFKRMLALYSFDPQQIDEEPAEAAAIRQRLNDRIRNWVGAQFTGLSATHMLQWRAIVVEERFNVSLSPWKESNGY